MHFAGDIRLSWSLLLEHTFTCTADHNIASFYMPTVAIVTALGSPRQTRGTTAMHHLRALS